MIAPGQFPTSDTAATRSALRTLALEHAGLAALEAAFACNANDLAARFSAAVDLIGAASGRVIITGIGKSGHVARKLAATFASTGTPAYFVHPSEASHGDLGMIQSGDVILALSWSGETAELADIITYSRRFGVALIGVTGNGESHLCRAADFGLVLPRAEEACPEGLAPTTSAIMQAALGDALAIALIEAKGFSASDFSRLHPGGRLGAKLTFVRDLMHRGERLPLVALDAGMGAAIVEISAQGFGCVGVQDAAGKLAGIITDGDLRRNMHDDLLRMPVAHVMTKTPLTIGPKVLAGEALQILNSRKITALFVVDEYGQPCGLVHMHDLLRLGVV
ncbi:MAG: SIS domain-containing protein [Beijerinckiaceae bacterium]